MYKERNRIYSDKQSSKQQEQKPSYQIGYYGLYQKQNQITNPYQVKNKLPTHELDTYIGKKRDIIMINQQQYPTSHPNQKAFNRKQQEAYQQQNNSSFYYDKSTHPKKQQAPKLQQIQHSNQQSKSTNQKQNMSNNLNFEQRKPQNKIFIREIEDIQQVGLIKVKNKYDINENQIQKRPQVLEKKQQKKQFEGQFQNMEPKEKDVIERVRQHYDVYQENDKDENKKIIIITSNPLETQDSQNESNNILDSNISILRTFNFSCFECNLKIESVCIQTPCQHSFHKNCIIQIMKKSLLQNGFQINCKCTEKLPQYFIRNHDQELFKKLLEQQIKKIENDQRKDNIDQSKEKLLFLPDKLLEQIQQEYENDQGRNIHKCYYHK
ncbi:hypothetical protein pb186bvf_020147 [Paramecium bursaria]